MPQKTVERSITDSSAFDDFQSLENSSDKSPAAATTNGHHVEVSLEEIWSSVPENVSSPGDPSSEVAV